MNEVMRNLIGLAVFTGVLVVLAYGGNERCDRADALVARIDAMYDQPLSQAMEKQVDALRKDAEAQVCEEPEWQDY
ncbi:hypothetical protein D3C75_463640 [compost metagenome]